MAEGVSEGGQVVAEGVYDDPDNEPPADASAPKGYAWNRKDRKWKARIRGPIVWQDGQTIPRQQQEPRAGQPGPDRDPGPAWMDEDPEEPKRKLAPEEVPQEVKDDIAGLAGLIGTPVLAVLQQMDPYCGSAIAQSFGQIVDATLPLITRSEKIVRYFQQDKSDWLLWGKLAMALAPVGRAIFEHHIVRTVQVERDDEGQVHIMRRGEEPMGDHLTPPVVDPLQYAA